MNANNFNSAQLVWSVIAYQKNIMIYDMIQGEIIQYTKLYNVKHKIDTKLV